MTGLRCRRKAERREREKKLTRLVIRGGKDKKKPKTWAQVPDFLCQHELRVTMATRQWRDIISSSGCLT